MHCGRNCHCRQNFRCLLVVLSFAHSLVEKRGKWCVVTEYAYLLSWKIFQTKDLTTQVSQYILPVVSHLFCKRKWFFISTGFPVFFTTFHWLCPSSRACWSPLWANRTHQVEFTQQSKQKAQKSKLCRASSQGSGMFHSSTNEKKLGANKLIGLLRFHLTSALYSNWLSSSYFMYLLRTERTKGRILYW